MKRFLLSAALVLAASICLNAQITFGTSRKINEGWKFCLDSIADYSGVNARDSKWRVVDLPHDWSVESVMSEDLYSCTGYLPGGVGWYRKSLLIPESESERKQFLYFGGVYCNSEVWINGHSLGVRPNGYVPFIYDITPYVKFGKPNQIAVKADHSKQADSRWYTGSGIYRDVYLVSSGYLHIDNWGVFVRTGQVEKDRARLDVSVKLVNETDESRDVLVEHRVFRKESSDAAAVSRSIISVPAGEKVTAETELQVQYPVLWSVENPALYRVETKVSDMEGRYIDGTTTVTGIRVTDFDSDKGFFLNGVNMKMKGVCLHHDAGSLGSAVPESVLRRRLLTLKDIGVNAIRMSHNLQDETLYDLCDELGFLVMDEGFDEWEFPKRKWLDGWNHGEPGFQGYADYFNEWAERDLRTMIERDKNHPSVVLWSIGNEVDYPNDPYSHPILDYEGIHQKATIGYKPEKPDAGRIGVIAEKFAGIIKEIDTTRAVTGAMAGVVMSNHTKYPYVLDVTGYNYTEDRYITDHLKYPERVIYGSENRHEYEKWVACRDNGHIFGQFLWTGIDYLGEAWPYPSRGFNSGLLDLGGFMKPRGEYRKVLWSDKPHAYIGTAPRKNVKGKTLMFDLEPEWNYKAGEIIRVAAFSNLDSVRLFLNDREITSDPVRDRRSNSLCWNIPFEPGCLRMETWSADGRSASREIKTHGTPVSIEVFADRQVMDAGGDVVHVFLNILDEEGTRVRTADNAVKCTVEGAGEFLRMENASPSFTGPYISDSMPAYKGRLLAYVKSSDSEGRIKVRFDVEGLGSATLEIAVE